MAPLPPLNEKASPVQITLNEEAAPVQIAPLPPLNEEASPVQIYSHSMIDLWMIQYVVVSIIFQPQFLYRLYELYCFTKIFWVENWSAIDNAN